MGRQVLDLSRALSNAPRLPGTAPDLVFFDLFGLAFVHYPPALGWVPLVAAVALFAAATWGRGGLRGALVIFASALLVVGNLVSGVDGPVNYYDRLAAIPLLQVQALMLCLGALAGVAALLVGHRSDIPSIWAGAAALPLLGAALAQTMAPTTAFPFAVAMLAAGAAAAARSRLSGLAGTSIAVVAASIGVGYLLALSYLLLQGVGGDTQIVAALPLVLAAPILLPLAPSFSKRRMLTVMGLFVAAGLAIAAWVRLDATAPTVPIYSSFH